MDLAPTRRSELANGRSELLAPATAFPSPPGVAVQDVIHGTPPLTSVMAWARRVLQLSASTPVSGALISSSDSVHGCGWLELSGSLFGIGNQGGLRGRDSRIFLTICPGLEQVSLGTLKLPKTTVIYG